MCFDNLIRSTPYAPTLTRSPTLSQRPLLRNTLRWHVYRTLRLIYLKNLFCDSVHILKPVMYNGLKIQNST